MRATIPPAVQKILQALEQAGFEAFIVGGSLRDLLLDREPKDWDITTSATPGEIQKIFPDSVYENVYGTVGVKVPRFLSATPPLQEHDIIEVTTYRTEQGYTDQRHPDEVRFVKHVEEDLARRDFTINAMAASITVSPGTTDGSSVELTVIDPFRGRQDLNDRVLRAVGNPEERFTEDALRLMRAVRLVVELSRKNTTGQLDWTLEGETAAALKRSSGHIVAVAAERIRDELSRILLSRHPMEGVLLLEENGLLEYILPELREGIGITQNLHHVYTVWEHNLRALATCPSKKLSVRLAALLHDVAKPRTKRGEGYRSTFYNHDHVGARMVRDILTRLRYPKKEVEHAARLVDNHLFYYNVGEVTEASVRRLIRRVGLENMDDLMAVRIGDRLGSGVPKAKPYKLRHLEYMIDKVSRDAVSVKMLKVNGTDLIEKLGLPAGPKIGALLDCLLAEVIEDAKKNDRERLLDRARELMDNDLVALRLLARKSIEEKRSEDDQSIRAEHHVQ
jgi:tRNA nucleotidyltransferase (CCA-adding enzyme)